MADFPTMTHVAVTVSDLRVSTPWYTALLGSDPVLDEDTGPFHHTVFALGDMLFGLHQHTSPGAAGFDERNVGLDHIAFGVPDRAELESWADRLDEMGVAHSDIVDAHYGCGLSFRDPDNIALELFAPPA
jgi:catechol 2,3-dioxygenase-like lactoylglutathione lyase family enzyme